MLTFGIDQPAEVEGRILETYSNEQTFLLSAGSETVAVRTSVVGEHHVSNCLAAAAVGLSYGLDLKTIATGLQSVQSIPGRMERVDCGQGYPVYVDAAETPGAVRAALRAAKQLATGRVICVLGERELASGQQEYALQSIVQRMADLAITTRPLAVTDSANDAHVEVAPDRQAAIAWAVAMAEPGDVVVIAGTQSGPSPSFGEVDQCPNDVTVVRELLNSRYSQPLRIAA